MGRTCDARKEIACPSHLGGAGRAHVEGESLGRMFRAGRHARYVPWSPEERGPGSGAPHLAWGPSLRHRNLKVWKKGGVVAHHWFALELFEQFAPFDFNDGRWQLSETAHGPASVTATRVPSPRVSMVCTIGTKPQRRPWATFPRERR